MLDIISLDTYCSGIKNKNSQAYINSSILVFKNLRKKIDTDQYRNVYFKQ